MISKNIADKKVINTVTGPIPPESLGYCQCHEHIFIAKGRSYEVNPALYMDDKAKSTDELNLYREAGGRSILDAQPVGCGRMAQWLYDTSRATGVNIIASTGFHKLCFYYNDHWVFYKDDDYITRLFINELKTGMYSDGDGDLPSKPTGYRAGIIKVAVDSFGIKGRYINLFDSAANAALETGAPVICHMEKGSDAFEVINFLCKRGLSQNRIILCHLDRAAYDVHYHDDVLKSGVYLEYDTIGRFKYHSDEDEIKLIARMVENGHSGSILVGLDTTSQRLKSYGGTIGLDYILKVFLNKMKAFGISREIFDSFTIGNPMKALSVTNPASV